MQGRERLSGEPGPSEVSSCVRGLVLFSQREWVSPCRLGTFEAGRVGATPSNPHLTNGAVVSITPFLVL